MALRVFIILLQASYVTNAPFLPVSSSCIYWDFLNLYPNGDTEKLHCIIDEKNQLGIVNVKWKWVGQGSCPYYDRYSKQIHLKPCDTDLGSCPDKQIFSYQAVKYSACVETNIRKVTSLNVNNTDEQGRTTTQQLTKEANKDSDTLPAINIAVSLIAVLILIVLVVIKIKEKFKQWKTERKDYIDGAIVKMEQDKTNGNLEEETENNTRPYALVPSRIV